MSNRLIDLQHITKIYDDNTVLDDLNLYIRENEFLTLLGPSGCGKTTTLRIIGGFEKPDNGCVLFNGKDITNMPPNKRQLNTVFQKYALFPHLNVAENIGFGLNLKKMDKDVIAQKVRKMLKMVGLEGFEKRDVTLLSGGQQQRVAIARALALKPDILCFDEPTSALDPELVGEVLDTIKKAANEGYTMLLVSHEMSFVRNVATRVIFLDGGKILEDGTPREVFGNPKNERVKEFFTKINRMEEPDYSI